MANVLGVVGIADKGTYDASAKYSYMNEVYYNGSSYLCINKDGCTGVTPSDDKVNWRFHARGLTAEEAGSIGVATTDKAGMVKIGDGLNVTADGTVSRKIPTTWGEIFGKTDEDTTEG